MKRFYSPTTQSSYLQGLNSEIPGDAVEISEDLYLSVIGNPAPGKVRAHDEHGLPYLIDAPLTVVDLAAQEREWRNIELSAVTWLRDRHRDQSDIGVATTLTDVQFAELLRYMQALRDWPQSDDFPAQGSRPIAPAWIADQAE
ncbi:phage tail protein [Pseudomonas gingeri NCPPB 3146 = LMG 5327]|uniref:Tail fiber assembly protein n=2 Tax=Pseudomonas gingeri TaxID=117681 RepID=A0A7Y7XUB1_9PSED|nr:phage tail assembly chaperone [Pseudomonas gingeri]NWC12465.1 tail fiber assembly protein [Pseudomonas gingeri]PNQ89220.1 phage tail protein [Pseudomonas gingeri NCPPB 3146 = LMG 5327]